MVLEWEHLATGAGKRLTLEKQLGLHLNECERLANVGSEH
jgi:hypothetical protein